MNVRRALVDMNVHVIMILYDFFSVLSYSTPFRAMLRAVQ